MFVGVWLEVSGIFCVVSFGKWLIVLYLYVGFCIVVVFFRVFGFITVKFLFM